MSMNYKSFFIDPITPLSIRSIDTYQTRLHQVVASEIRTDSGAFEQGAYSEWHFNQKAASNHKKGEKSKDLWKRYLNLV